MNHAPINFDNAAAPAATSAPSLAPFLALGGMAFLLALALALISAILAPPASGSDAAPVNPVSFLESGDPFHLDAWVPALEASRGTSSHMDAGDAPWSLAPAQDWCGELNLRSGDACEVREFSAAPDRGRFAVEGLANGSIAAEGWNEPDVRVRARVVSRNASSAAAARRELDRIGTRVAAGRLEVEAPRRGLFRSGGRSSWSVDIRMQVPVDAALNLSTTNGAVAVAGVHGGLDVRSTNGAVSLARVAAPVRARTTNGSVTAVLERGPARGESVELTATNGSLEVRLPRGAGAQIEARTSNGRITSDLPLEVQGARQNQARGTVGNGGGEIRLRTTNGPIRINGGG